MPGKRKRGSYRKRGERVIKEYKKSKWTKEEDELLKKLVLECYDLSWLNISRHIPGKSPARCQYRWVSYLDTRINHKPITNEEKLKIKDLFIEHGSKYGLIASKMNRDYFTIKNCVRLIYIKNTVSIKKSKLPKEINKYTTRYIKKKATAINVVKYISEDTSNVEDSDTSNVDDVEEDYGDTSNVDDVEDYSDTSNVDDVEDYSDTSNVEDYSDTVIYDCDNLYYTDILSDIARNFNQDTMIYDTTFDDKADNIIPLHKYFKESYIEKMPINEIEEFTKMIHSK